MTRARSISRLVSDQVTGNVNISGILTATTLFGDGAGISGVSPVGSGVTILDGGVSKGSASKIDFADHFTVSTISSGIATITVGVTTEYIDSKQINNAGVVTTSSAIVGSAVTINSSGINVNSGIVTAPRFEVLGFSTVANGGVSVVGTITATNAVFVDCGINDTLDVLGPANFTLPISANGGINASGIVTCSTTIVGSAITINSSGINASGIITARQFSGNITGTAATFTGNVTIGGTLTYDDVTNVDSIGLITARNGLQVTGGITTISGQTNLANLNVSGVSTFTELIDSNGGLDVVGGSTLDRLNVTGLSTFAGLIDSNGGLDVVGGSTLDRLNVTGLSTFAGITTVTGQTLFSKQLNVSGVSTFVGFTTFNDYVRIEDGLIVSGVSTFTTAYATELVVGSANVEMNISGVDVSGIVTASQGFISVANTSPVQIRLVGNQLTFNVVGIGSTTLTLA